MRVVLQMAIRQVCPSQRDVTDESDPHDEPSGREVVTSCVHSVQSRVCFDVACGGDDGGRYVTGSDRWR